MSRLLAAVALALLSLSAVSSSPGAPDVAGCYELSHATSRGVHVQGDVPLQHHHAFLAREVVRCLEPDGGLVERRTVTFTSPHGGHARVTAHLGAWSLEGGLLALRWEDSGDGGEWEVEPFEGGLQLGDELWRRLDLEPAQLLAGTAGEGAEETEGPVDGASAEEDDGDGEPLLEEDSAEDERAPEPGEEDEPGEEEVEP